MLSARIASLALFTMANAGGALLMRQARSGDGKYDAAVAMLATEVVKLVVAISIVLYTSGPEALRAAANRESVLFAMPALLYMVQGNLVFFGYARLEAPVCQALYEWKILLTGLLSWAILGRQLKASQWLSLTALLLGNLLLAGTLTSPAQTGRDATGIAAIVSAAGFSSFASIYTERLLKASGSIWLRNVQLGTFALLSNAALVVSRHPDALSGGAALLRGFSAIGIRTHDLPAPGTWASLIPCESPPAPWVWAMIAMNSLGGFCVAASLKYASAVDKSFATALSVCLSALLSVPIFGFAISSTFAAGLATTLAALLLFSVAPDTPPGCTRTRLARAAAAACFLFFALPAARDVVWPAALPAAPAPPPQISHRPHHHAHHNHGGNGTHARKRAKRPVLGARPHDAFHAVGQAHERQDLTGRRV
jgi:UDP-sugar transporter A1/2/3